MHLHRICRTLVILGILSINLSQPGSAQTFSDPRCKQADYVSGRIDRILTPLEDIGTTVETVPPNEANYIREEARLALEQGNEARFNLVAANQFYYPLQFHDHFKVAVENLEPQGPRRKGKKLRVILLSFSHGWPMSPRA